MLELDSQRWEEIPASPGGTGALAAELLRRAQSGDDGAYAELYHQVCHQFSVGLVAYVAVPHLVKIARTSELKRRVWPLSIVGTIAAARLTDSFAPAVPSEWEDEYLHANSEALVLTADALRERVWELSESQTLLAALSALHGHADLAMHLFLQGGNTDLSCPVCGEYITFRTASDPGRPTAD